MVYGIGGGAACRGVVARVESKLPAEIYFLVEIHKGRCGEEGLLLSGDSFPGEGGSEVHPQVAILVLPEGSQLCADLNVVVLLCVGGLVAHDDVLEVDAGLISLAPVKSALLPLHGMGSMP